MQRSGFGRRVGVRRIKVWVGVGETTKRLYTLFCFHLMFSVHNHGNFCQCCSGSEILGEILKGSLLTAHCFLFFCFYKASKGLHRSAFFPGRENREREGQDTQQECHRAGMAPHGRQGELRLTPPFSHSPRVYRV